MTALALAKRRPARVASDTAHSWARNLRLRNSLAKLVLSMLTLYVQGDGVCFVGVGALSEDTELSEETVRRRLAWLEQIGAVVRMPQWIDENGRRNSDGRGKRTSDEIRLMLESNTEDIEARAAGMSDEPAVGASPDLAPPSARGLNGAAATDGAASRERAPDVEKTISPPVSPLAAPALQTGADSLNHEPEPIPPNPPRGTGLDDGNEEIEEQPAWPHAESWSKFEAAWTEPILHQQICRQIWTAFTEPERQRAIRVARGYGNWLKSQHKPPNRCNAQKMLRERDAWLGYEKLAGPDPALRTFVREGSREFDALAVTALIGSWTLPPTQFDVEQASKGIWRSTPVDPDQLGLAIFADKPIEQWTTLEPGTTPHIAWSARLRQWVGKAPPSIRVPCLFPPRRDGSIGPDIEQTDANLKKTG